MTIHGLGFALEFLREKIDDFKAAMRDFTEVLKTLSAKSFYEYPP